MKRLSILGSTGSIGVQALDVVSRSPERFSVVGLSAGRNVERLAGQVRAFRPLLVSVADAAAAADLRARLGPDAPEIRHGEAGAVAVASLAEADFVLAAISGGAGLRSTAAAVDAGKPVGLANKESLVLAGELVMRRAAERNVPILPVDSEHSAIFQSLAGHNRSEVRRLILTASGGPLRNHPRRPPAPGDPGRGAAPPQLEHGREDHHRLGDPDEQGARGHRGPLALRRAPRAHRDPRSPGVDRALDGRVRRRPGGGPARDLGHAGPDQLRAGPSRPDRPRPAPARPGPGWGASPSSRPTRPASRPSRSPTGPWRWAAPRRRSSPAPTRGWWRPSWPAGAPSTPSPGSVPRFLEAHRPEGLESGGPGPSPPPDRGRAEALRRVG